MTYPSLPAVGSLQLPELVWQRSANQSGRNGRRARLVFVHAWGGGTFASTAAWLRDPASGASAHVVYAGEHGHDAGRASQLVAWNQKAWTECELNPVGLSVESADAIWQGHDPAGFARLAVIVAGLCTLELDACRRVEAHGIVAGSHGFTFHRDAGALGCGHLSCPSTNAALLDQFSARVVAEYRWGGFGSKWGR